MKRFLLLLLFVGISGFAQQGGTVYNKDGVSITSYTFQEFESLLQQQDDQTYVVNFWATWCAPCIKELPYFEKLHTQYKGKNVKVILVSLDMKKQIEGHLLSFIKRKKLQAKVVHLYEPDANSWISKVDENWTGAIPATVIYNKNKRKFYEKSFTYAELEKEVKSFIN